MYTKVDVETARSDGFASGIIAAITFLIGLAALVMVVMLLASIATGNIYDEEINENISRSQIEEIQEDINEIQAKLNAEELAK